MAASAPSAAGELPLQRIHFWQHGRAVGRMLQDYPPGADTVVDDIRARSGLGGFVFRHIVVPLYFAREYGWTVRGTRGEMAACIYVRRKDFRGIRVVHIDELNVGARYRHRGLASRLMNRAEELARQEQCSFLTLAVTVANTPAVTLYQRLGYQAQFHRYFTYMPARNGSSQKASDVTLRPLGLRAAREANRQYYQLEMQASEPQMADLMVALHPAGAGGDGVPKISDLRYAIEHDRQQIGFGDAYRKEMRWNLRMYLQPQMWGTDLERQAFQLMTTAVINRIGHDSTTPFVLHVPSTAHFNALRAGTHSLASEFGFVAQSYTRTTMVKPLATVT